MNVIVSLSVASENMIIQLLDLPQFTIAYINYASLEGITHLSFDSLNLKMIVNKSS